MLPMRRKAILWLMLGLLLICVALLGGAQWHARWRFRTRGWMTEPTQAVADTGFSSLCVNAALGQYDAPERTEALEAIREGGFVWVRQDFPWSEIEPAPGEYDWAAWDPVVADAVEHGLQLLPVLSSPPAWAGNPPDPEAFARFAGAFANHYMAQLVYYQIWHNPNLGDAWSGEADPYAYAELLMRAAEAIRAADPDARIVLGGLAPNVEAGPVNYSEVRFLELLYGAGAAPYFDVVAVQPYGFDTGPDDRRVAPDRFNFSRALLIRELLVEQGDADTAIWASDFGWNHLPPGWDDVPSIWGSVDAGTQATYTVAAFQRAEDEWPWMGVLCLNTFQPRPPGERTIPDAEEHWGFALVGPDGEPRLVYDAVQAWASRPEVAQPGTYPASTALATFEGGWRLGPLGADIPREADAATPGDRVRLRFEGTGAALTVRRGPYRAFLFVTVDGEPAPALPRDRQGRAYVVLYDPLAETATVPLAEHLPPGEHVIEVTPDRGWYQWALADWRIVHRPDPGPYRAGLAGFALLGLTGSALTVAALRAGGWDQARRLVRATYARLDEPLQVALTAVVGIVFGAAAWLTWSQDAFRRLGEGTGLVAVLLAAGTFYLSPWLLLTLASGAVLLVLVALRPDLGLALTLAASPLYLHPLSLFGKSFSLAELLLLPTLVGWSVRLIGRWKEEGRFSVDLPRSTWLSVAALVVVALLSTASAAHRREALREWRLVIVEPALFFLMLVTLPLQRRDRWRVVDFYVASGFAIAAVGLVQYFVLGDFITAEGGIRRLRSFYGSPNNVGLYLGRMLPLLVAVVLWARGRRRWLYAAVLVPVAAALLLSFSRGALLLGGPAGILTLGFLAGRRWRRAAAVLLLVFLVALIPLFSTPRFAGLLNTQSGTTFFRLALWRSAWNMVRDHPLLGVGPDNFLYAYRTRYVLPSAWEEFDLAHPHNWLFDFASRLGLLGLAVFVWIEVEFWRRALAALRHAEGRARALALGIMGSMAVCLAHGLVDAAFFYVDLAYVFFFGLAVIHWLGQHSGRAWT